MSGGCAVPGGTPPPGEFQTQVIWNSGLLEADESANEPCEGDHQWDPLWTQLDTNTVNVDLPGMPKGDYEDTCVDGTHQDEFICQKYSVADPDTGITIPDRYAYGVTLVRRTCGGSCTNGSCSN